MALETIKFKRVSRTVDSYVEGGVEYCWWPTMGILKTDLP